LTAGLGFGALFAISGLWNDDGGIHRFNMLDQSLFVIDLSPTVAYRVTDNLSLGLALNVVAFKELRTQSLFGPAWAGAPGAAIALQSDEDFWLPVPPYGFDPSFDEVSVTLGGQYRISDRLRLGLVYRSETPTVFEGVVSTNITGSKLSDRYSLTLHMPGHEQVGAAYELIPNRRTVSADLQVTNWSDADGFGAWNVCFGSVADVTAAR
jgi:long-subunit fatty acid transport protein